jgi:hypothetical protein
MIVVGMEVIVGGKYAHDCSYTGAIGKQGKVSDVYISHNPYMLKGKHTMCCLDMPSGHVWEIHVEDCLPISNKHSKKVLIKYDDY